MRTYKNLKLENQLCFAVYAATNSMTRAYRKLLRDKGLTFPQYLVMLVLLEKNGLNVKAIADRLILDSATLTPILRRMEKLGMIERNQNLQDERIIDVNLTNDGHEMAKELFAINTKVDSLFSREYNFEELNQALNTLINNLAK
jgi:DNA-binding MarR family transcriptional regulator